MFDLEALRREVGEGRIETIITALPDLYGRLVGKRITGHFFLEEIAAGGMHVCNYLLACDMEMDPTRGYNAEGIRHSSSREAEFPCSAIS